MIADNVHCTACGACLQTCKLNAITMKYSEDGFLYPAIDREKCVECGACEKVCPLSSTDHRDTLKQSYAAVSKSQTVLSNSTSGGVFFEMAKYVLSVGGYVFGCAFDDSFRAKHICITEADSLSLLQGSKYVQSDIGNTYCETEKYLKLGKAVLFSGTPCQIDGLKHYLKKDYENLYTCDVICHGVTSQKFFDKYLEWYQKKHKIVVKDYSFRSKENSGWSSAGMVKGTNAKGLAVKRKLFYYNDYYYFYYMNGSMFRENCYECRYANANRVSDFTLGDFWGVEKFNMPFNTDNGCSLMIVNTEKGSALLDKFSIEFARVDYDKAIIQNKQLTCPSGKPDNYVSVIQQMNSLDSDAIDADFKRHNFKRRIMGRIKYATPKRLRKILKKVL